MKIETEYSIGDTFVITGGWLAVCTAITVHSLNQVEYRLEWIGETEFCEEWLSKERMDALGIIRKEND